MGARWLGLGLLWTVAFLTVAAPSLSTVVPGLPNDHYHAFADPMVVVLAGLGVAMAVRDGLRRPAGATAVVILAVIVGWNLAHLPPGTHPDGGYPAGQAAGDRADGALTAAGTERSRPVLVQSLPHFKSSEAMAYPLARLGRAFVAEMPSSDAPGSVARPRDGRFGGLVLLCDDRFAGPIGASLRRASRGDDHARGRRRDVGAAAGPVSRRTRPLRLRLRAAELGPARAAARQPALAASPGIANAGAPDAGVRCPRDPDGGGRSGSCPGN